MLVAPYALFAAAKSLPQPTYRYIVDTPEKVVVHVRIYNTRIHRMFLLTWYSLHR